MCLSDREYEFFVTTDENHQPEGTDRGLIRRLVMRNFFEAKWAGSQNNTSEHNSASTVMAKKQLKNRFRLPKPGNASTEPQTRRTDGKQELNTVKKKRPKAKRRVSGATDASEKTEPEPSLASSLKGTSADEENNARLDKRIVLMPSPSAHRFDPFDVLPVPGTPQLDMLFKLCNAHKCYMEYTLTLPDKSSSTANSIAVNAKNTWWSFISSDAGLLHATLATWALYGVLVRGLNELRVDKLRHKNEALREINIKIGSPGGKITDELVGTVLTMASFEVSESHSEVVNMPLTPSESTRGIRRCSAPRCCTKAHGQCSWRTVRFRAQRRLDSRHRMVHFSLSRMPQIEPKTRHRVDFHTAAAFHTPPTFPPLRLDPATPPLPDKLLESAALTSPTSPLHLSTAAIPLFNIFYRLHRLALAASSPWTARVNRLTLSNLLYETEHLILCVPDHSRAFLALDLEIIADQDAASQTAAHAASIVQALLAAAHIFVYAALRALPTNAALFAILLERLRGALARPCVCAIRVWRTERQLDMLLWSIIVACSVAPAGASRGWWIGQLAEVMDEVGVESRGEVEKVLRRVAWVDTFFQRVLSGVWEELALLRRAGAMVDGPVSRPVDAALLQARMGVVQQGGSGYVHDRRGSHEEGRWRAYV